MKKWIVLFYFAKHMGLRYIVFRIRYEVLRRTGVLKHRFPINTVPALSISKDKWRMDSGRFLFRDKESLLAKFPGRIRPNPIPLPDIPTGKAWVTNPENGYEYNSDQHWASIRSFSEQAGDIKAVWEPSRFTFLYDLIRRDFHYNHNSAETALMAMEDWISNNPVNRGPNWKCGQEIALRVFNWTFALHYYRNSPALTESRLNVLLNSIRAQVRRVDANIRFSRNAVQNNHALTETLLLYAAGLLYPFFPESAAWRAKGKKGFEEEICLQINEEGAYIQHSMNYHRAVIQLLTLAIRLAEENGESWAPEIYNRAAAAMSFLSSFQEDFSGRLPNYGSNDGALFFPLTSAHFRDYRPQLGALSAVLKGEVLYQPGSWQEETFWWSGRVADGVPSPREKYTLISFPKSGYFVAKAADRLLFLRCGAYRRRPAQSDNLHLDLWINGENVLFDAGTFRYNTNSQYIKHYEGTEGHNTVAIERFDQMLRGPRFIWSHWIRQADANWSQHHNGLYFDGTFTGYHHIASRGITHQRTIWANDKLSEFIVTDTLSGKPDGLTMRQLWHPTPSFAELFTISAQDEVGEVIKQKAIKGWYSECYGRKNETTYFEYATSGSTICTHIIGKIKK